MTIKDIARISGCSVSTISRVINDRPDVRPETKEHVLKVMREAGFTPNTNARQLKIQQSRSLVFIVKGTRNLFFSDFLVQLQRAATLYGYNGIVSYLDENANEIDAAEKILREIKPKGIIFLGGSVSNFQNGFSNITVPSVLATLVSHDLSFPNLSMVGVDDRAAARTAVAHLIAQGHSKIAVLGGPATSFPSRMRRLGAQDAMEDADLVFDNKLYGLSNYDFESAYHAMNSLLARRAEFTALFAIERRHRLWCHPGAGQRRAPSAGGRLRHRLRRHHDVPLLCACDDHHRPAQRADRAAEHRASDPADRARCLGPDRDPAAGVAAGRKRLPLPPPV